MVYQVEVLEAVVELDTETVLLAATVVPVLFMEVALLLIVVLEEMVVPVPMVVLLAMVVLVAMVVLLEMVVLVSMMVVLVLIVELELDVIDKSIEARPEIFCGNIKRSVRNIRFQTLHLTVLEISENEEH